MRDLLAQKLRGIYAIVNERGDDTLAVAHAALEAGANVVQYRAKDTFVPAHAQALREITRTHDALLIINDDFRAVRLYDADGVHLGPDDAQFDDVRLIRSALPDKLIGLSVGTVDEAGIANKLDLDYIGVGSVYATSSKPDAGDPIGLDGLRAVAAASRFPVAAIGGVGMPNIEDLRGSGVAMAAVISAISSAADPFEAARELVAAWGE
ncbi:MAG: thiamine phosphate synthase [Candidatus Eremiobacteraeota bacterium]|nr:thiamine phosphate synthase [Candidatus Eremiobacteraeota bacterium]